MTGEPAYTFIRVVARNPKSGKEKIHEAATIEHAREVQRAYRDSGWVATIITEEDAPWPTEPTKDDAP